MLEDHIQRHARRKPKGLALNQKKGLVSSLSLGPGTQNESNSISLNQDGVVNARAAHPHLTLVVTSQGGGGGTNN